MNIQIPLGARAAEREDTPRNPCRNLWFEVLRRAITDWSNGLHDPQGVKIAEREDLPEWFLSDKRTTGSFRWICEALNIGEEAVQQVRTFVTYGHRFKI